MGPNYDLSESEMLRRDLESFVENKRSCLPKCTLKQVKMIYFLYCWESIQLVGILLNVCFVISVLTNS